MTLPERPNAAHRMLEKVTTAMFRMAMQREGDLDAELPSRDDPRWNEWRDLARVAVLTYMTDLEDQDHTYLATSCRHGEHGYCQSNTGSQGDKIPAVCKFCGADCVCFCHLDLPVPVHARRGAVDLSDWDSPEDAGYDDPSACPAPRAGAPW